VPFDGLLVSESVRYPGATAQSGLEVRTRAVSVGLWVEPIARLGMRSGIRCSFR
jgi:hypothetical protein